MQSASEMDVVLRNGGFVLVDDNNKVYVEIIDNFYVIVHARRRWAGP